ncbi:uncharacterized protein LY89DRAFT_717530 [Mollisia scopiformis]|uniref:Uncharacterized protein n=1 Tax=Mollisia scopiformis TaxID=149040 RepID=A0A194XCG6_MOLSC|nr:uncharacterized protein LY89DRAFT_717530 [Mollisia scopiformis]KUJ17868.1 hypothetical protein LY89DRAFT_717530 [Mollisia scopiformis]
MLHSSFFFLVDTKMRVLGEEWRWRRKRGLGGYDYCNCTLVRLCNSTQRR